jgi:predicted DNA binding CopG/RHH family protein
MAFTYRQLQDENKLWVAHNFPGRHPVEPVLGLMEEFGEREEAALKGDRAELLDACADVTVFAADLCNGAWSRSREHHRGRGREARLVERGVPEPDDHAGPHRAPRAEATPGDPRQDDLEHCDEVHADRLGVIFRLVRSAAGGAEGRALAARGDDLDEGRQETRLANGARGHAVKEEKKDGRVGFRLSEDELERLNMLAEHAGMSASAYVRKVIRDEYTNMRARNNRRARKHGVA